MSVLLASIALAAPLHPTCERTYSVEMGRRAIDAIWRDHTASPGERIDFHRYLRCQRNPHAGRYLRWRYRHDALRKSQSAMSGPVIASWYDDSGTTGCGFHAVLGVATLIGVPCGGSVLLCHRRACVTATRDDSGPYVGGRSFDLNAEVRAALGCPDLCDVTYSRS